VVSRLCEEFHCVPSVAWQEWMEAPAGWLEEIIEARHYAICKARLDAADTAAARQALPESELLTMAEVIMFELAGERLQAARDA
jgi:hypothetical protein